MQEAIARHKTAISRTEPSRPIKFGLADGIITHDRPVFDYGCGLGDDLRLLATMGFEACGWDPVHRADAPRHPSAVVNIGYVINVIENPGERQDALRAAWALAEHALRNADT